MATIGQQLLTPDSDWERFEQNNSIFTYSGTWTDDNQTYYSGGSIKYSASTVGQSIKFKTKVVSIRIIGRVWTSAYSTKIGVYADGVLVGTFSQRGTKSTHVVLNFEYNFESEKEREITITNIDAGNIAIDAVDIIAEMPKEKPKLALKNPTTNQHYSLSEKTLIPLPNASDKNMILHGIEAGKEIQLDEAFDKINYPVEGVLKSTAKTIAKPLNIKFE